MDSATLAGRRLWIGIPDIELGRETERLLRDVRPGGVVLFRRNVESLAQVRRLVAALRDLLGPELLLSVDQEGGLVVRFYRELTVFPGNMALGALSVREPSLGEHLAEKQGYLSGLELKELDLDVNLSPVLDLATRGSNPGIGIRSFGEHKELARRLGAAMVRGMLRAGITPALKHFPGKGEASVDAHLDLPVIGKTVDQAPHLEPFRCCLAAGAPLVMTSHVIYEALDEVWPATLSPRVVTGLLREQMGFGGGVMTDDLEMGAMTGHYGMDQIIQRASLAGHDVFCICHQPDRQRAAWELLRRGCDEGAPWFGDPADIIRHLESLAPTAGSDTPPVREAEAVATAIAGRAITVLGALHRLPIRPEHRALLVLPTLEPGTPVENPLRGEEDGETLAEALGASAELMRIPADPTPKDIDSVLESARGRERLLVVLTLARFRDSQADLARRAVSGHPGTILLPLRNPFDLEVLDKGEEFAAVVSYGFRPAQLRALAAVLLGSVESYGRLPVTLRTLGT